MDIIIDYLGEQNQEIEDDILAEIEEEIESIDKEECFKLAIIAIKLGKPQILEYLIDNYDFKNEELKVLCNEINTFKKTQEYEAEDSEDEEDIDSIMKEFTKIIKNYYKLPYKNKGK